MLQFERLSVGQTRSRAKVMKLDNSEPRDSFVESILRFEFPVSSSRFRLLLRRGDLWKSLVLFWLANALVYVVAGITRYGGSQETYLLDPLARMFELNPAQTSAVVMVWFVHLVSVFLSTCRIRLIFRKVALPKGFVVGSSLLTLSAVVGALALIGFDNLPNYIFLFVITAVFSCVIAISYARALFID